MPHRDPSSRSTPCNGKLISRLRKELGWTQSDLAQRAGFTERLIVKAESSQPIAASTLKILSETFQESGQSVTLRELATDPEALAREFFRSTYKYGPKVLEHHKDFISPDLVVHFAGDPNVFPFAGTHIGIVASQRAFDLFYSVIVPPKDDSEMESMQIVSTAHGALVWGETWARPIGMLMEKPMKFAIKMDFKDGLMTVFDNRFDTFEGAKLFAGPSDANCE